MSLHADHCHARRSSPKTARSSFAMKASHRLCLKLDNEPSSAIFSRYSFRYNSSLSVLRVW